MSIKSTTFTILDNELPSELVSVTKIGPVAVVAVGLTESDLLTRL